MFNSSVAPADVLSVEQNVVTDKGKPMDVNRYATKKTVAQGMLDIALLTANASQLKYILQTGDKLEFYVLLLWLITTSIILQITSIFDIISSCSGTGRAQNTNAGKIVNDILRFVNEGGEVIDSYDKHEEIILVLGNAESGKSSFASYMGDELDYLYARRISADNSARRYSILDSRNKIVNSLNTIVGKIVPRLVENYRLKKVYYDCPAFGAPYSELSSYFTAKIIDTAKRVKLVFVASYESVRSDSRSSDFSSLVRHATTMLKNTDKFYAGVTLIVTKADNEPVCDTENRTVGYVSDDQIIDREISVFLKRTRDEFKMKLDRKSVTFVNTLLERSSDGKLTRIALFRRPDRSGPLRNSKALRESKQRLDSVIDGNVKFVACHKNDFNFDISDTGKRYLDELSRKAREYVRINVRYIGDDIRKHYLWREKMSDDLLALKEIFEKGVKLFSDAVHAVSVTSFIENLKKIVRTSNIFVSSKNIITVRRYDDFLNFLYSIAKGSDKSSVSCITNYDWKWSMMVVVDYLNNSKMWYVFLIDLFERLSGYGTRRNVDVPAQITIDELRRILNQSVSSTLPSSIDVTKVDELKLRFLKPIFNVIFYKLIVSRQANMLTVRGSFVKLSDVVNMESFNDEKIKIVRVFATNTVFLDIDVDATGREMKLLILAPEWHFVCDPRISLSGRAGEQHVGSVSPTAHGSDGLPGKPGGPAGHFFGIGQKFVGVPSVLHIDVSGGRGGPGQGGFCGLDGPHGEDCRPLQPGKWWKKGWRRKPFLHKSKNPKFRKELQEGNSLYTHTATINSTASMNVLGVKIPTKRIKYEYDCVAADGKEGGKGGDGGVGGKGGIAGSVQLIDISNRITFKCSPSTNGCVGVVGSGSAGGCPGKPGTSLKATFEEDRVPFALYYRRPGIRNEPILRKDGNLPKCNDGVSGKNSKNVEEPRKYPFGNSIRDIVDYKKFAREYAMYAEISPVNVAITSFVHLIESDARVNTYDDTRAFIYDLLSLENQFYSIHAKVSTLPCYEFLAQRILRYADNANGTLLAKDKAILSYLYSTVLSKISTLKRDRNFLVMDFDRYCKSVLTEIKKLNKLNHIDMINEYKMKYENLMNIKIDEARRFIDETIIPTIDSSFKNSEKTIKKLIAENVKYISASVDKQQELKKVIRQLHSSLISRRILSVMQLGGQFLQFLGPVGAIVGPAVEKVSMVATSLVSPSMEKVNGPQEKNLEDVRATLQRNSEWVEKNRQKLRNEVIYITRQIERTERKESVDLKFLMDEVEAHEKRLKELEARKEETPFWIMTRVQDEFKTRLNKLLEQKEYELQRRSITNKAEKKTTYLIHAVRRIKRVIRISWDIIDLIKIDNVVGDPSPTVDESLIENELDEISGQLSKLREYEMMISNILVPLCDKVYSEIRKWEKQLRNKSPASLRMSQWNVQYSLRKIKKTLKEMTDGYKTQNVVMEIIEQIEEGLSMLIDMYDHIEKYHERVELEAYIANVNSYRELGNALKDPEIDRLNVLTRSNVILNLFDNAIDAFRQAVFPFAHLYFEDFVNLPDSLSIENNTDNLVQKAISRINNLNEKVRQVSSQLYYLYDNAIVRDVPFTFDNSMTPPFYLWNFKANNYVLEKLFSGQLITLTSHITRTRIDENAVKFKNLRIRFLLTANTASQTSFDKLLENFSFELTHSGEMYFRCGRQFYFFKCNRLKMTFSIKLNEMGEPESANQIYRRIKDNYYVLSPYTTWNVKLVKNKYWNGDFRILGEFANYPMKVVLEGLGEYVKRDIDREICNASLSRYYEAITL